MSARRRRPRWASSAGSRSTAPPSASAARPTAGSRSRTPAPTRSARSSDGELEGGVIVCPCHASEFDLRTGDVLCPPALEPLPIYEARVEAGELQVRLSPPPAAAEAVHEREDHVPEAVARAATTSGPSRRGPRPRRRRPHRPRRVGAGRAVRVADAAAARGAALLAARAGRPGLLGVHPLRRHRADVEGLGDLQLGARRHLAAGPDARGGRGAEVDDRHRPARSHPAAGARQQGLHAEGRQHLRGAHPRPRPAGSSPRPSSASSSTGSRTSPPRSRCGCSPRSWGSRSRTGG